MVAYEKVFVVTEEGDKLKTSKLRWDNADKMIRSDEKVMLERGKSIIYGIGFESDPELNSFKTTKMVGYLTGIGFESDPELNSFKTTKMVGYLTEEEVSEYSGEEEE